MPTFSDLMLKGEQTGRLKTFSVRGFVSAGANGSAAITGLSAAVDIVVGVFYTPSGASVGDSFESMGTASTDLSGDRLRIYDTNTTNGRLFGFWWDADA